MKHNNFDPIPLAKRTIVILMTMFLLTMLFYAVGAGAEEVGGQGFVTVLNTPSTITDIGVYDNGSEIRTIMTEREYEFRVDIKDTNTICDVDSITLELWLWSYKETGTVVNKKCDLSFEYETDRTTFVQQGVFFQSLPNNASDLDRHTNSSVYAPYLGSNGTWSFFITQDKFNGCNRMEMRLTVFDGSEEPASMISAPYYLIDKEEEQFIASHDIVLDGQEDLVSEASPEITDLTKAAFLALAGSISCVMTYYLMGHKRRESYTKTRPSLTTAST